MTDWTTLLERVGMRRPRPAPVPERATRIFPIERIVPIEESTPHVPREYRALYTYLEHRYASVVVLLSRLRRCSASPCPRPQEPRANGGRRSWIRNIIARRGPEQGEPPHPTSLPGSLRSSGRCDAGLRLRACCERQYVMRVRANQAANGRGRTRTQPMGRLSTPVT